tara:strand:- start:1 stop:612 length:612 start_codon:yes stop_codon:yes gene_type:complete
MYLVALSMIFASLILVANITAVKIISIGPESIDAGIVAYPLTFLISDVISEIYGKRTATKIVWMGFAVNIMMVSLIFIVGKIPPAPFWIDQSAYDSILGSIPRIVAASMLAFLISQNHDVLAFDMWKRVTKGKYLWFRNNASTSVSQLIDTVVFVIIAFAGTYSWGTIWSMIWVTYIIKLLVAVLDTPILYFLVWKLRAIQSD